MFCPPYCAWTATWCAVLHVSPHTTRAGALSGDAYWSCPRTIPLTAPFWTRARTLPTPTSTISTQSRAESCWESCRGEKGGEGSHMQLWSCGWCFSKNIAVCTTYTAAISPIYVWPTGGCPRPVSQCNTSHLMKWVYKTATCGAVYIGLYREVAALYR